MSPITVRVDDELLARLPGMRVTTLAFTGVRMGGSPRAIEPLRDRVIAAARERITAARDVRRIPSLAAFHRAFPEMARGTRRPWIEEAYRGISRRDPFPVVNLAVDAGRLLALHFAVPVSAIDRAKVSAPLFLRIAPPGMRIKSLGAEIDAGGLPVLTDAGGVAGSPFFDVARAMPGTQTTEILVVVCEPEGASAPVDPADLAGRAANWLGTLTGARPAD